MICICINKNIKYRGRGDEIYGGLMLWVFLNCEININKL